MISCEAAVVGQFDLWQAIACGRLVCGGENHMPIKLPVITEMDLMRAREIERSCETFRGFSSDQAEAITRAIAQGIAVGRKLGMELAYAPND
jgi:hypothetical protein